MLGYSGGTRTQVGLTFEPTKAGDTWRLGLLVLSWGNSPEESGPLRLSVCVCVCVVGEEAWNV